MPFTIKNILLNLPYYALLYILMPWILLKVDAYFNLSLRPSFVARLFAVVIGTTGISIQLWAIFFFQKIGKGTPLPSFAPKILVTAGPYRWVRNPINIGELMLLFAISLWCMSITLFVYTLLGAAAFQVFIVAFEEPKLKNNFGAEYKKYNSQVNRWIPKIKK